MFTKHNPKKTLLADTKAMAKLAKAGYTRQMVSAMSADELQKLVNKYL